MPWLGDSEGSFRSSSQAATCPHVYHTWWDLHTVPFNCWTSSREAVNSNFYSLWFDPTGNRTKVYRFSSRLSIHSTTDRFKVWKMVVWKKKTLRRSTSLFFFLRKIMYVSFKRCLSNSEDECTHLRHIQEQTQNELASLAASHQSKVEEVNEIMEKLQVIFLISVLNFL